MCIPHLTEAVIGSPDSPVRGDATHVHDVVEPPVGGASEAVQSAGRRLLRGRQDPAVLGAIDPWTPDEHEYRRPGAARRDAVEPAPSGVTLHGRPGRDRTGMVERHA